MADENARMQSAANSDDLVACASVFSFCFCNLFPHQKTVALCLKHLLPRAEIQLRFIVFFLERSVCIFKEVKQYVSR